MKNNKFTHELIIEIRKIDALHKSDINIKNEPFPIFGRLLPSYSNRKWNYEIEKYAPENIIEMCFPDENYDYESMTDCVFLGAYDGDTCIGLAVLQPGFFKYMYLYDMKVNSKYRKHHIGKMLAEEAKKIAVQQGYYGIYTQAQDNNLGACLFYLNSGFYIGGIDTNVYCHTEQESKTDIIFYCEAN